MGKICREPSAAASGNYDLIIVGGGIYGVMLSLEASKKRLRSLLLERDDFGGATTFNSLRILHGGLRYLQGLDLHRFRESVGERRWFMQNFPDLVKPLPCIMPLYGNGFRRPSILRLALWANDLLSFKWHQGTRTDRRLPNGHVVNTAKTREIFPSVDTRGLQGAAIWCDACMPDSQRLVIEILRWACGQGATALNYVEAQQLIKAKNSVAGVLAYDRETGKAFEYKANVVVNAAGPWCRGLADRFDRDEPKLFRSSLAWNVLLNRKAPSDYALAVVPKKPGGRTYFLFSWKGMLLAGTGHAPWYGSPEKPMPSHNQLQEFLNNLNGALPGLEADEGDILHIFAGLLPVTRDESVDLVTREVIYSHAGHGGPRGLYSISGVKFTTSRRVAEKTLEQIFPEKQVAGNVFYESFRREENGAARRGILDLGCDPPNMNAKWKEVLLSLINEESVLHLEDLIFRRTSLWENPDAALNIAPVVCQLFPWNDLKCNKEIVRLTKKLEQFRDPSERQCVGNL